MFNRHTHIYIIILEYIYIHQSAIRDRVYSSHAMVDHGWWMTFTKIAQKASLLTCEVSKVPCLSAFQHKQRIHGPGRRTRCRSISPESSSFLVNCNQESQSLKWQFNITMQNRQLIREISQEKLWFPIVMLVYQRVTCFQSPDNDPPSLQNSPKYFLGHFLNALALQNKAKKQP